MYPNETTEHHRDHRCRNKEVNQFCYDPISKYRGNFCGCITRYHPVWAGSRSWVSRHLSLHLSNRGDEVRVRSCLIFRYRIWPKKQCILEKHSNLLQKYNSCRLLLTITHKHVSSHETRKHRHIVLTYCFDSAFFKSYQIWMFTQAWRYIIHLRYFPLWMQKTSLCDTQNFKTVP